MSTADGRWHAGDPVQRAVRRKVFRNEGTVRVWAARVFRRLPDGTWEREHCDHHHQKKRIARLCAERTARRWNREDEKGQR